MAHKIKIYPTITNITLANHKIHRKSKTLFIV